MVEYDIPRLFPGREKDVILHMDSAPAHKAQKTVNYLNDVGRDMIRFRDTLFAECFFWLQWYTGDTWQHRSTQWQH